MRKSLARILLRGATIGSFLIGFVGIALADAPTAPNISPVVVPLAQTGTFGQTVCSVLGQAQLENDVVLTVQGHGAGHIQ